MILGVFESWAQLLDVMGTWLAAIATFAAAYIALSVANRANVQNIEVFAKPMVEVTRGSAVPTLNVFYVKATNVGMRPVTITHLAVKSRLPKYNAILMEGLPGSSKIPITVADGESANWRYPESNSKGDSWYKAFADQIEKRSLLVQWLFLRNLRFYVVTSLGHSFFAPVSEEFQKKVREQLLR